MHNIPHEQRVMSWDTHYGGTAWLDGLVESKAATLLAYNGGYPLIYEVSAATARSLLAAPPLANTWKGQCPDDADILIVEVWDQS